MKKKQYFGNERGALAGLFIAVAAFALLPICIVIYQRFWSGEAGSFDRIRRNDVVYNSSAMQYGLADEIAALLDAQVTEGTPHCVARYSKIDPTTVQKIQESPIGCVTDPAAVEAAVLAYSGSDASSLGDYNVIIPGSPNAGSKSPIITGMPSALHNIPSEGIIEPTNACFTGDTLVAVDLEDGHYIGVPISALRPGDKILGFNDQHEITARLAAPRLLKGEKESLLDGFRRGISHVSVIEVLIHTEKPDQVVKLGTANGSISTNKIHPFFVLARGWVSVSDIELGSQLISPDGESHKVTSFEALSRSEILYNLETEGHTYFVVPKGSNKPIWVHNAEANKTMGEGS